MTGWFHLKYFISLYEWLCWWNTRKWWKIKQFSRILFKFKHFPNLENITVKIKHFPNFQDLASTLGMWLRLKGGRTCNMCLVNHQQKPTCEEKKSHRFSWVFCSAAHFVGKACFSTGDWGARWRPFPHLLPVWSLGRRWPAPTRLFHRWRWPRGNRRNVSLLPQSPRQDCPHCWKGSG